MARAKSQVPQTLEEAVAELKRDPSHPLRLAVDDVEVEMRLLDEAATEVTDDVLKGATWHGDNADDLIQIIRDGRELDDTAKAPHL